MSQGWFWQKQSITPQELPMIYHRSSYNFIRTFLRTYIRVLMQISCELAPLKKSWVHLGFKWWFGSPLLLAELMWGMHAILGEANPPSHDSSQHSLGACLSIKLCVNQQDNGVCCICCLDSAKMLKTFNRQLLKLNKVVSRCFPWIPTVWALELKNDGYYG